MQKSMIGKDEPNLESTLGQINLAMPSAVVEAGSSFCAEESRLSLVTLANTSLDPRVASTASKRAGQIETSKSFFENSNISKR
ncbi:hypothetical protein H7Y63_03970 [Polaromonas sp.]|nr:hypothetical protein [Candidatus Saccharibacteria bacterium]